MTDEARHARNATMLLQVYKAVRPKFAAILTDLEGHGLRPRIQCAWRSRADQLKEYEAHFSRVKFGFHNVSGHQGQPEALACDVLDDDHPEAKCSQPYVRLLESAARAHGLSAPFSDWDPYHVQIRGISITAVRGGMRPA